jgi:hypothetical protein
VSARTAEVLTHGSKVEPDLGHLLRSILEELRGLRADFSRRRENWNGALKIQAAEFLHTVDDRWGNSTFRAGELVIWAADPAFAGRRAVLDTARALLELPAGANVPPHALGLCLARLAGITADGLRLERVEAHERGSRLWRVARLQG